MTGPRLVSLGVALAISGFAGETRAASPEGGIGIGYLRPVSQEISDPYGGGVSFHLMGELQTSPSIHVGAEVSYRHSSATLAHPDFVDEAKGTLQAFPIDLLARIAVRRGAGTISPYVGAGAELLWLKERFTYRIAGRESERKPGSRFGIGPVFVVGLDRVHPPRLRLEAGVSLVSLRRALSIGDASLATDRINAGAYGARIIWRLP